MKIVELIIKENKKPLAVLGLKILIESALICKVEDKVLKLHLPEYCWIGYEQDTYPYYTYYISNKDEIYGLSKNNEYKIELFKNHLRNKIVQLYYVRELLKEYGIKDIIFTFREKKSDKKSFSIFKFLFKRLKQ